MGTEYFGYTEMPSDDHALAKMFDGDDTEVADRLFVNEYMITKAESGSSHRIYQKSPSGKVEEVKHRTISSRFLGGGIKAKNPQQVCAIDMLYNSEITVKMLAGKFGSGKTFLMTAAGIDMIERGKFDKIVYVRNNIEVKNSKPIGFLPGTYNEKLLPFAAPLADHLGGMDGLELMMRSGKVEVMHLGFIRGRDIKNSIIFCSEAENLTKEHVQLLISRVGEGSELWLDGDVKQRDEEVFFHNSGMSVAIERLANHPRFGYVKLVKTERSETAAMADLLD